MWSLVYFYVWCFVCRVLSRVPTLLLYFGLGRQHVRAGRRMLHSPTSHADTDPTWVWCAFKNEIPTVASNMGRSDGRCMPKTENQTGRSVARIWELPKTDAQQVVVRPRAGNSHFDNAHADVPAAWTISEKSYECPRAPSSVCVSIALRLTASFAFDIRARCETEFNSLSLGSHRMHAPSR